MKRLTATGRTLTLVKGGKTQQPEPPATVQAVPGPVIDERRFRWALLVLTGQLPRPSAQTGQERAA